MRKGARQLQSHCWHCVALLFPQQTALRCRVHGDDIFVAGPRQEKSKMGATLKKRWETPQSHAAMVQGWVCICSKFEAWQGGCLSKSKPVSSPATGDSVTRFKDDDSKPLDEEEKRLYQRVIAKLNYLAHDRLDLKYATSCLSSAVSSPCIGDMRAAKRVGRFLRKAPVAWLCFPFHDPWPEELLCYTDADWASDKTSRRSTSGVS